MELPEKFKYLEGDAKDAAYRLAARQFLKVTREPLVAFLLGHLGKDDPSMRAKIGAFLDTELGEALVSMLLSLGLSSLPASVGEISKNLAKEFRVRAMTDVGDVVADLLMEPLREIICNFLQGEPAKSLPEKSVTLTPVPNLLNVEQEAPVPASVGK